MAGSSLSVAISLLFGLSAILIFGFLELTLSIYMEDVLAQSTNLTGTWLADDGGTYYMRNIGNDRWWLGISNDDGSAFSNVLKGNIHEDNNTITAVWRILWYTEFVYLFRFDIAHDQ
jgi:hypothetical protein